MNKFGKKETISLADCPDDSDFHMEQSADAIPDLGEILKIVQEMLEFIESPNMNKLEESFLDDFTLANELEDKANIMNDEKPDERQQMLELKRKVVKLRKVAKRNKEKFEAEIYSRYNSILPMKIISLMTEQDRDKHLDELMDTFELLNKVKNGKISIDDASKQFGEGRKVKYVYPKFGGKDAFEKLMTKK